MYIKWSIIGKDTKNYWVKWEIPERPTSIGSGDRFHGNLNTLNY